MRLEQIRGLLTAQPFRPFMIHLAEGRAVPVLHRDFALLAPDGRTLFAYGADHSFDMIDVMLITSIHLDPLPQSPNGSNDPIPTSNGQQ